MGVYQWTASPKTDSSISAVVNTNSLLTCHIQPHQSAPGLGLACESFGVLSLSWDRVGAHRKDLADGGGEGFDLTPHPFSKPPAQTGPTHS